jgi:hypothetical protein
MTDADLWWQTLAGGPLLLALFDAEDRLLMANPAYRASWGMAPGDDRPTWAALAASALATGSGPAWTADELARAVAHRGRLPQQAFEQVWRDGRRLWWVELRTADGGLVCTGLDLSAVSRSRGSAPGVLLEPQAGRELLQTLLADSRAWPLCVATLVSGADAAAVLARVRSEDGCARLEDGRVLVMLPSTGPAQAAALVARLGPMTLTEARWGETAAELILRA